MPAGRHLRRGRERERSRGRTGSPHARVPPARTVHGHGARADRGARPTASRPQGNGTCGRLPGGLSLGVFPSMKSLTFIRGVAFAGALTLTHAATAFGAESHTTSTAKAAPVQSAAALAQASGENTPLGLTHTAARHAASSGGGASIVRTIVGLAIVIAVI